MLGEDEHCLLKDSQWVLRSEYNGRFPRGCSAVLLQRLLQFLGNFFGKLALLRNNQNHLPARMRLPGLLLKPLAWDTKY